MRRSSRKDSDGILRNVTFACGRSSETRSKYANILRPQPNAKTGCNTTLGASLGKDGKWRIRSLNLEHNHALLTPTKSRFFRCNRSLITYAKKKLIKMIERESNCQKIISHLLLRLVAMKTCHA